MICKEDASSEFNKMPMKSRFLSPESIKKKVNPPPKSDCKGGVKGTLVTKTPSSTSSSPSGIYNPPAPLGKGGAGSVVIVSNRGNRWGL